MPFKSQEYEPLFHRVFASVVGRQHTSSGTQSTHRSTSTPYLRATVVDNDRWLSNNAWHARHLKLHKALRECKYRNIRWHAWPMLHFKPVLCMVCALETHTQMKGVKTVCIPNYFRHFELHADIFFQRCNEQTENM